MSEILRYSRAWTVIFTFCCHTHYQLRLESVLGRLISQIDVQKTFMKTPCVLSPFDKHAWFGAGVNPNARVQLDRNGRVSDLLNDIERQLQVGFTPSGDTLKVERFVSRTFELELPPGMISDQIGSGDSSESTSGGDEDGGSAKVDGQYVTLLSSDVDVFGEVALGVRALLQLAPDLSGEDSDEETLVGSVQAVPSLSRLVVRTTPGRMREIADFVAQSKASLTRQVALEVHG